MVDAEGTHFDSEAAVFTTDVIQRSAIRRYLEPLELGCALHYDSFVAREDGYLRTSSRPTKTPRSVCIVSTRRLRRCTVDSRTGYCA